MAANDAWMLQGLNGADVVGLGQTFTGRSHGALVLEGGDQEFVFVKPSGAGTTAILSTSSAGQPILGVVTSVVVTSGQVQVFPDSTDYTIA